MSKVINGFFRVVHKNFFQCIILSYAVAGFFPALGYRIKNIDFGKFTFIDGSTIKLSLSLLMLSALLFNAGLGMRKTELTGLLSRPKILLCGLTANLIIPIGFTFAVSVLMRFWHNPDEVQNILVGLALIASMPIAASSTAWAQKSNGNLALSLGLVLFSTTLSLWTTPLGLHSIGFMATGDYADDLHEIAGAGTEAFLFVSVLLPITAGVLLHFLLPANSLEQIKKPLKDINLLNLILLNYANASIVLPQVFNNPDWDFLFAIVIITGSLCAFAFFTAGMLARFFNSGLAEKSSLMFGLGMNNNGTGLVLASLSLSDHPAVMLPIICYNLLQHVIAGYVDSKLVEISVKRDGRSNVKLKNSLLIKR